MNVNSVPPSGEALRDAALDLHKVSRAEQIREAQVALVGLLVNGGKSQVTADDVYDKMEIEITKGGIAGWGPCVESLSRFSSQRDTSKVSDVKPTHDRCLHGVASTL